MITKNSLWSTYQIKTVELKVNKIKFIKNFKAK